MSYGIKLKVWGEYACFTRPEMKAERVSYEVMTPSAARGILEAIYWKPEISWVVDRIHVLKPIRFTNIRRNEVADKISARNAETARKEGSGDIHLDADDTSQRVQRAAMVLRNVAYVIEAHFVIRHGDDTPAKHREMFLRRATKGQTFHQPYLGCREFPAHFEPLNDVLPVSACRGEHNLGFMLHDIDFDSNMTARFFHARMRDGVIEVPPWNSSEVRS